MNQTDEDIRKVLEGDIERYGEIVRAFEPLVRAVVAALTPDGSRVEDLTQETFLTAYRRLRQYQPGTHFKAWLRAIARNVALNERRRWFRKMELLDRHRAEVEDLLEAQMKAMVNALSDDALGTVRDCVKELNEKMRGLIENFYFRGLSVKELAEQTGMSEGAVRVALFRARQEMAIMLKKRGVVP
jgi:RNA polymerase sigma-70 factor (ECF subfamily)